MPNILTPLFAAAATGTTGWQYGETLLTPAALTFTITCCLLMLVLPRKFAVLPLLAITVFMPLHVRIVVGGLDLMMIRILVLFGLIRIFIRGEYRDIIYNNIDKTFIGWIAAVTILYTIQRGTGAAFVYRMGVGITALGTFFIIRSLVLDLEDYLHVIKFLVVCCVIMSVFMLIEHYTRYNTFSILGGVSSHTMEREGRLRCQGAFAHPILAGTFGAAQIPLFISAWTRKGIWKILSIIGITAAMIITWSSSSSGPIITLGAGLFAMGMWRFRHYTSLLRWGTAGMLVLLHFAMKAPVWYLIARMDFVGGSTGFHRSMLIDKAIRNFPSWFLVGTPNVASWGYRTFDVTNEYIYNAINGGFATLVLFLMLFFFCFKAVGELTRSPVFDTSEKLIFWSLGAALFAHSASMMGVSYYDQSSIILHATFAIIASMISFGHQAEALTLQLAEAEEDEEELEEEEEEEDFLNNLDPAVT